MVELVWPVMLVGLGGILLLLVWWWTSAHRWRVQAAQAFADVNLLPNLIQGSPLRAPWLPHAFYFMALLCLVFGGARPVAAIPIPVSRATVILTLDVSKSMVATDLAPSRLEAAKQVAREFLRSAPGWLRVGLVVFSDYAQVLVRPTTQHQEVLEALDHLQPAEATAVGSGILTAVRLIPGRETAGQELLGPSQGIPATPPPTSGRTGEPMPPGALLLISDGVSNFGIDPMQAAEVARRFQVKIYAVGVGTPQGSVQQVDGQLVFIPFDPTGLQRIAAMTGGRYFYPPTSEDLRRVYRELGRSMAWERQRTEVTSLFAAAATLCTLMGGTLSLAWFRRLL